jgi:hypothetical protein
MIQSTFISDFFLLFGPLAERKGELWMGLFSPSRSAFASDLSRGRVRECGWGLQAHAWIVRVIGGEREIRYPSFSLGLLFLWPPSFDFFSSILLSIQHLTLTVALLVLPPYLLIQQSPTILSLFHSA